MQPLRRSTATAQEPHQGGTDVSGRAIASVQRRVHRVAGGRIASAAARLGGKYNVQEGLVGPGHLRRVDATAANRGHGCWVAALLSVPDAVAGRREGSVVRGIRRSCVVLLLRSAQAAAALTASERARAVQSRAVWVGRSGCDRRRRVSSIGRSVLHSRWCLRRGRHQSVQELCLGHGLLRARVLSGWVS
jgi:hypothetical protein